MNGSSSHVKVTARQREALTSTVRHVGPTAERYQTALGRYVEAVAADRPTATGKASRLRLTLPPLTASDVMTRAVVSAYPGAQFKEIAAALDRNGINAVPVIDAGHRVVGVVSASDLLARVGHARAVPRGHRLTGRLETARKERGATARDLMTAPAVTISPSTSLARAARTMARHRLRSLPVVTGTGVLLGMVSRADLIKLFLRGDEDIANDVLGEVVRAETEPRHRDVRVLVREGVVTLSGRVDTALAARALVYDAARVPGVIAVEDELEFTVDDRYLPARR